MRGPSRGSPGTTNDRITVHIAEDTTPAELQAVAREVASTFDLSLPEAEALLKADVIVLKQDEAEALVAICQRLGIRGKMTKPKPPASRTARLGRQTLPWLLALLGVVVLVTLVSLVLPEVSVSSDGNPAATSQAATSEAAPPKADMSEAAPLEAVAEPAPDVPVIATAETTATDDAPTPADDAVPQIASATVSDEEDAQMTAPDVPTIASSLIPEAGSAEPVPEPPDLFTAARDLTPTDVERALTAARLVDARDVYGQTPLMYAAGVNSNAVVTVLLAAGADANAISDAGWTPLMYAARNTNDPGVVKTLLAAGADATVRNESGQGARDIALAYNNSAAALIPAPVRPETETTSARENLQASFSDLPTPTNPPATVVSTPAVGGGRPITITPRPLPTLSFPPPVPVQRAPAPTELAPSPVPSQTVPSQTALNPVPSVQPVPQDEEHDVILDCLQNWDTCGN